MPPESFMCSWATTVLCQISCIGMAMGYRICV